MTVALVLDNRAAHVQASPFVYTQPRENGLYSLEVQFLKLDAASPDTVLILPDGVEVAEGEEITDELWAMARPFSMFERATKEQAAADALGLVLRASVAEGDITDDDLLRIAPALDEREWRPDLDVTVGDVYAHEGYLWRCIAEHTTQADWRPPFVPALWRKVEKTTEGPRVWQTLTDYAVDDVVHYPDAFGSAYRCITGHMSQEGWEPPNVPALWAVCEGAELPPEPHPENLP